ncbi:unnamed protein product [Cuscuta epithymum]|uniref:Uncharacterized protein n=1 Tax=Cuscuta epithymum TaxID=186058 RepID=A0AAV0CNF4_9ASTE|nr:unnamed protein product [Cuscuta epithymum]
MKQQSVHAILDAIFTMGHPETISPSCFPPCFLSLIFSEFHMSLGHPRIKKCVNSCTTPFGMQGNTVGREDKKLIRREKASPVVEMGKGDNEVVAGWPSFGQLIWDLANLSLEAVSFIFTLLNPLQFRSTRVGSGLTPLKDSLIMPEDEEVEDTQERRVSAPVSEITTRPVHPQSVGNSNNLYRG